MDSIFEYDNVINIFLPAHFSSRWKFPMEKITYRKNTKKKKSLPKPKIVISLPRKRKIGTDKIKCPICNKLIQRRIKAQHSRTKLHQRNLRLIN